MLGISLAPPTGACRNAAWSDELVVNQATIPIKQAFDRIKASLPTTVADVERALSNLEMAAAPEQEEDGTPNQVPPPEHEIAPAQEASLEHETVLLQEAVEPEQVGHNLEQEQTEDVAAADMENAEQTQLLNSIEDLFITPQPPILWQRPATRQRRVFEMSAVRRSARLAKQPAMPPLEKAQRNLCRKMGITEDEFQPIDQIIREFISTFVCPLPENIIAALTAAFDLDDDNAEMITQALLQHAGEAVDDLQREMDGAEE
ncbi:unnamed protein product [Urochloa humidicola]